MLGYAKTVVRSRVLADKIDLPFQIFIQKIINTYQSITNEKGITRNDELNILSRIYSTLLDS